MRWTSRLIWQTKTIISRICRMKSKRRKKPLLIKKIVMTPSNIKSIPFYDRSTISSWSASTSMSLSTLPICKDLKSVSRLTQRTTCIVAKCAYFLEAGEEFHISGSSKELTKKRLTMKRPNETRSLPNGIKRSMLSRYIWLSSKRRSALKCKQGRNLLRPMKCP